MPRIRTREDCLSAIQSESSWRKKEIISLRAVMSVAVEPQGIIRRASVVMLYAHWEGFVKKSSSIYIDYLNDLISRDQIKLCMHFQYIALWLRFRKHGDHLFLRNPLPFLDTLSTSTESIKQIIPLDVIDLESNLNSNVLKKIAGILNLEYEVFRTKEKLIDVVLLPKRNKIAHGDRLEISNDEYDEIDEGIRELISIYQNEIEKCIQQENYRFRISYEG